MDAAATQTIEARRELLAPKVWEYGLRGWERDHTVAIRTTAQSGLEMANVVNSGTGTTGSNNWRSIRAGL